MGFFLDKTMKNIIFMHTTYWQYCRKIYKQFGKKDLFFLYKNSTSKIHKLVLSISTVENIFCFYQHVVKFFCFFWLVPVGSWDMWGYCFSKAEECANTYILIWGKLVHMTLQFASEKLHNEEYLTEKMIKFKIRICEKNNYKNLILEKGEIK